MTTLANLYRALLPYGTTTPLTTMVDTVTQAVAVTGTAATSATPTPATADSLAAATAALLPTTQYAPRAEPGLLPDTVTTGAQSPGVETTVAEPVHPPSRDALVLAALQTATSYKPERSVLDYAPVQRTLTPTALERTLTAEHYAAIDAAAAERTTLQVRRREVRTLLQAVSPVVPATHSTAQNYSTLLREERPPYGGAYSRPPISIPVYQTPSIYNYSLEQSIETVEPRGSQTPLRYYSHHGGRTLSFTAEFHQQEYLTTPLLNIVEDLQELTRPYQHTEHSLIPRVVQVYIPGRCFRCYLLRVDVAYQGDDYTSWQPTAVATVVEAATTGTVQRYNTLSDPALQGTASTAQTHAYGLSKVSCTLSCAILEEITLTLYKSDAQQQQEQLVSELIQQWTTALATVQGDEAAVYVHPVTGVVYGVAQATTPELQDWLSQGAVPLSTFRAPEQHVRSAAATAALTALYGPAARLAPALPPATDSASPPTELSALLTARSTYDRNLALHAAQRSNGTTTVPAAALATLGVDPATVQQTGVDADGNPLYAVTLTEEHWTTLATAHPDLVDTLYTQAVAELSTEEQNVAGAVQKFTAVQAGAAAVPHSQSTTDALFNYQLERYEQIPDWLRQCALWIFGYQQDLAPHRERTATAISYSAAGARDSRVSLNGLDSEHYIAGLYCWSTGVRCAVYLYTQLDWGPPAPHVQPRRPVYNYHGWLGYEQLLAAEVQQQHPTLAPAVVTATASALSTVLATRPHSLLQDWLQPTAWAEHCAWASAVQGATGPALDLQPLLLADFQAWNKAVQRTVAEFLADPALSRISLDRLNIQDSDDYVNVLYHPKGGLDAGVWINGQVTPYEQWTK